MGTHFFVLHSIPESKNCYYVFLLRLLSKIFRLNVQNVNKSNFISEHYSIKEKICTKFDVVEKNRLHHRDLHLKKPRDHPLQFVRHNM